MKRQKRARQRVGAPSKECRRAEGQKRTRRKSTRQVGARQKSANQLNYTRIVEFHIALLPCKFSIMDSMILHKRVFYIHFYTVCTVYSFFLVLKILAKK